MPKTSYPLTSVRFFAASLVLFHHSVRVFLPVFSGRSVDRVPEDMAGIVALAFPVSASFFFFLSGYVLSFVYLHNARAFDTRAFFAARFARLYPLYFVVLTLDTPELLVPEVRRYGLKIGLTKTAEIFAANAVMLQVWNPSRLLRINLPSWSLCGEVFFYACFPLLGALLWKLRGAWLRVVALAVYVGGQTLVWVMRRHLSLEMTLTLPLLHLSTFALGILMARWQTLQQERTGNPQVRVSQASAVLGLSVGVFWGSALLVPFLRCTRPLQQRVDGTGICSVPMGAYRDSDSLVTLVVQQMAYLTGECELCTLFDPYATPLLVPSISLSDPCVLSGVPRALRGAQLVKLPFF